MWIAGEESMGQGSRLILEDQGADRLLRMSFKRKKDYVLKFQTIKSFFWGNT